jgi:exopolyphosphatase/guanosine-5'-triphosphate,3'-diphosphate pyrophosphatase
VTVPARSVSDEERVAELLGRPPRGSFSVVVRDAAGDPVVIRNSPILDDGIPMPTLYWLVGSTVRRQVDRLESTGGVDAAEAAVDPVELADAHARYAAERDRAVPSDWFGPTPSGGVGGTRRGVKCLHAHYAWYLAGGDDPVGRWIDEQLAPEEAPVAAIDCGTNSTRLLVAGPDGRTVERLMTITRLGQDVDRTGRLAPEAVERTLGVLVDYRKVMDRHGVRSCRMTATAAARDAANRDEFFDTASRVVGVRPELIDGAEEGALSFAGATFELPADRAPYLVADIGGGSTELALGPRGPGPADRLVPAVVRSLPMGCVRVSERFFAHDPPTPSELASAAAYADGLLDEATGEAVGRWRSATLVGVAGTVAAVAAVELGLERYDRDKIHGHRLTRETVDEVLDSLAAEPAVLRRRRPGVEAGRADVIVGGVLVLSRLMRHLGSSACLVSESDILDGLAISLRSR